MAKLSIVIVSGIFPPDHGGPATYVPEMARALAARGHRVEVVCLADSPDRSDPAFAFPVKKIRRDRFKPMRAALTALSIARSARHADVLFVNGLAVESWLAALATGKPAVHKVVGDVAWERATNRGWFRDTLDEYQRAPKSLRLRAHDWLRTAPLRHARSILVPSLYLRDIVRGWRIPEEKIRLVRNAARDEDGTHAYESALPPFGGRTIVTISRLVAWKGLEALVRIVAATPEWRLVIVGDGPLRPTLERQRDDAGAAERIVLAGAVPRSRALSFLRAGDVFVLNSTYEGLPHVVLEAMAVGVPVVATRAGGTPEVVVDRLNGRLVSPGDDEALRRALRDVLDHPEVARRYVVAARERLASEFSFERMVDATERSLVAAADVEG